MTWLLDLEARFRRFLFGQEEALRRIALVRISLGLICLGYVLLEPYDQFVTSAASVLYRPGPVFPYLPALSPSGWALLKYSTAAFGVLFTTGLATRASSILVAILFAHFNYYVAQFTAPYWVYSTHINICLFAIVFCDSGRYYSLDALLWRRREASPTRAVIEQGSFILSFMQLFVAVLYFQAALGKTLLSGFRWFITGQTPYVHTIVGGTDFGRYLTQFPWLFTGFVILAFFIEYGFIFVGLYYGRFPRWLAVVALLFHLGITVVIRISFWHLVLLYPALFIFFAKPRGAGGRGGLPLREQPREALDGALPEQVSQPKAG